MHSYRLRQQLLKVLRIVALILLGVFFIVPIYLILVNAFKESGQVMTSPLTLPIPPVIDSILSILKNKSNSVLGMYKNSVILLICVVPLSIVFNSMASYYLARNGSRFSKALHIYFLMGLMVPYVIVYIPLALVVRALKLSFGIPLLVLIFLAATVPFSTFMYTNFIKTVPKELEEAAAIDGAGKFYSFWHIIFPLLKPCTATIVIFNGLGVWNDFQTPLLMGQVKTITVGIYTAIGPYSADWGLVFGYLLFAVVPVIIAYLLLQKQFVAGLTSGATKG